MFKKKQLEYWSEYNSSNIDTSIISLELCHLQRRFYDLDHPEEWVQVVV